MAQKNEQPDNFCISDPLAKTALVERERERDRLRHSLELAMEVQQNLLPKSTPRIKELDIAAESIYFDETGGDCYDFLDFGQDHKPGTAVVIGDVSGHGIPSALLVASARSALRQRCQLAGNASQIISDVNRQLTEDVEESGRFITLFFWWSIFTGGPGSDQGSRKYIMH